MVWKIVLFVLNAYGYQCSRHWKKYIGLNNLKDNQNILICVQQKLFSNRFNKWTFVINLFQEPLKSKSKDFWKPKKNK